MTSEGKHMLIEALEKIDAILTDSSGKYVSEVDRTVAITTVVCATLSAVQEKSDPLYCSVCGGQKIEDPQTGEVNPSDTCDETCISGSGQESIWRVVSKVYVYRGDTPICHCHTPEDTAAIVEAMNETIKARVLDKFTDHLNENHVCGSWQECAAKIEAAKQMVHDLCQGRKAWVMHVPAEPDSDPDLVIYGALTAAEDEIKRLSHPCHPALSREEAERMADELYAQLISATFAEKSVTQVIADALQRVAGEKS